MTVADIVEHFLCRADWVNRETTVDRDGSCYWAGIQRAEDAGHPVIRVNHGTSEEPGMVALTEYINANLPGLHAEHLPHGSTFRLVGAETQ
ncbi:MAG: hypothetical protein A3K19_12285 [Lentisphaerae bacterium RIFOXYB12_FULL_65_16]|nr:MAG: hypothetical protein A3K18_01940 [Lentisphaerae bacterium RIFOXYA12_64_32]OGV86108.1 MAG: hypothetical protein A3K19_12285 [Lentisphaerae bacterium RIFOXYB12_FULL_65_16]